MNAMLKHPLLLPLAIVAFVLCLVAAGAVAGEVAPITADLAAPAPDDDAQRLRTALIASGGFALREAVAEYLVDGEMTPVDTGAVRKLTGPALAHAVGLRLGGYDDSIDRAAAREQAIAILDAVAATHVTSVDEGEQGVGGWGRDWQSPIGVGQGALAAWLLWDELSPQTQAAYERLIADEADHLLTQPIFYYRDRAGKIIRPGNTGSEEESWRARGLSLAVAMLPDHPNVEAWKENLVARELAAFAAPSDVKSDQIFAGKPLSEWLEGSNIEEDGTLINHRRIHPTYMRTPHATMNVVHAKLAGQPTPASATHGIDRLYSALRRLYNPDGTVRYPQGNDWGKDQVAVFYVHDLQMRLLGIAPEEARKWEQIHGERTLAKIEALGDGRAYAPGDFGEGYDAEYDIASKFAEAWLALAVLGEEE